MIGGPHVLPRRCQQLVSTKQRTECCTMKNGVSLGIVAPLYSIGLILCRVKDMLRVDQYRRTSCKGTMLRQALNEKRRTIAYFHKRSHELALFVIQALVPWIFSSVCGHDLFISSFLGCSCPCGEDRYAIVMFMLPGRVSSPAATIVRETVLSSSVTN